MGVCRTFRLHKSNCKIFNDHNISFTFGSKMFWLVFLIDFWNPDIFGYFFETFSYWNRLFSVRLPRQISRVRLSHNDEKIWNPSQPTVKKSVLIFSLDLEVNSLLFNCKCADAQVETLRHISFQSCFTASGVGWGEVSEKI